MAAADYTPRAGTLAEQVLTALNAMEPGATLDAIAIAARFGTTSGSVSSLLRTAVNNGVLALEKHGRRNTYSLPGTPPDHNGPLQLCHYSTGELSFAGCVVSDGTVMLNATQLRQLIDYVTKPAVAVGAP